MSIKIRCKTCFTRILVQEEFWNSLANCPSCKAPMKIPQPSLRLGEKVNSLEIEAWLGQGASAEVYLARHLEMERLEALKIIHHDNGTPDVKGRFYKEIQNLARLEHSNITRIYDAGHGENYHYMSMQYIDGESLEDLVLRTGPLDEKNVVEYMLKSLSAIEYIWTKFKLVHRDIKPANIMLDNDNDIKIMDLGIAKNAHDKANITRSGEIIGTPFYMSSEQAQAEEELDWRSDLYSLACTAYYCLSGEAPFSDKEQKLVAMLLRKVKDDFIPIEEQVPKLSPQLAKIINQLMSSDPQKRCHSIAGLRTKLENLLRTKPPKKKNYPAKKKGMNKSLLFTVTLSLILIGAISIFALNKTSDPDKLSIQNKASDPLASNQTLPKNQMAQVKNAEINNRGFIENRNRTTFFTFHKKSQARFQDLDFGGDYKIVDKIIELKNATIKNKVFFSSDQKPFSFELDFRQDAQDLPLTNLMQIHTAQESLIFSCGDKGIYCEYKLKEKKETFFLSKQFTNKFKRGLVQVELRSDKIIIRLKSGTYVLPISFNGSTKTQVILGNDKGMTSPWKGGIYKLALYHDHIFLDN